MARAARPRLVVPARRAEPTVPPPFVVGPMVEVWAGDGADLGSAFMRHSRARLAWERTAGLDTATACALAPVRGPWSLDGPHGVERLAALGFTADALPELRRAAQRLITDTNSTHRRTP